MISRDYFSGFHPVVNFLYFMLVMLFTMIFLHPSVLIISMMCAGIYAYRLNGTKKLLSSAAFMLPSGLLAIAVNAAFNHRGVTVLAYLPSGNPLTWESLAYGISAAFMVAAIKLWFQCYSTVMSTDKFVYLFGRIIPSLSLLISMTLRFVPRFSEKFKQTLEAQKCIGRDIEKGSLIDQMKSAAAILSAVVTWSLENAVDTADSMKSRGYGLPGRTAFSIYQFRRRDNAAILWFGICIVLILYGWHAGAFSWTYYPMITGTSVTPVNVLCQTAFFALCITPVVVDGREALKWKSMS